MKKRFDLSFIYSGTKMLGKHPVEGEIPKDSVLWKRALSVAWPSTLESFLIAIVGVIDTIMVSALGDYAIAAIGLTTQPKFLGLALFLSLNVAVSAIVARRRGEQDREGANRVVRAALALVIGLSVIVSLICVIFAEDFMRLVGANEQTIAESTIYFSIIMGGMIFNVISMVINAAQRGSGNTKIAMRTNMVSNAVNICFNYILINGKFGFPALGVKGAAIATVLGTICALAMSVKSVLHTDSFICLKFAYKGQKLFDRRTLASMWSIGASTLAEQIFMRFGFLMYSIVIANLGTLAFTAHQVGMNILSVSFSFADGLSVAAVALVGQSLGQKRIDIAKIYGGICQRLGLICSITLAVLYFFFGKYVYRAFSDTELILSYGSTIMNLISLIVFLQIAQVIYSGCLRAAGDTKFVAVVSLISVGVLRPLCGFILCYPLGLGLIGAWIGIIIDQAMRLLLTNARFRTGKWMNIKI